jgi:predicted nuclease with TOPRIM domain
LLLSLCNTVAIAVDNDEHGMKGGDRIQNQLIDFMTVYRVILPEGKDVGDIIDREEYYNCLKKARKQFDKIEHL